MHAMLCYAMLCYAIVLSIYCNVLYHSNYTKSIINWNPQSNVVCTAINENAENWCVNHRTWGTYLLEIPMNFCKA